MDKQDKIYHSIIFEAGQWIQEIHYTIIFIFVF